jgi:hypothetical protein
MTREIERNSKMERAQQFWAVLTERQPDRYIYFDFRKLQNCDHWTKTRRKVFAVLVFLKNKIIVSIATRREMRGDAKESFTSCVRGLYGLTVKTKRQHTTTVEGDGASRSGRPESGTRYNGLCRILSSPAEAPGIPNTRVTYMYEYKRHYKSQIRTQQQEVPRGWFYSKPIGLSGGL